MVLEDAGTLSPAQFLNFLGKVALPIRIRRILILLCTLLFSLSSLLAAEDHIGLGVGMASGSYTEPGRSLALSRSVVDIPSYDHIFDNKLILGAQYSSFAASGVTTVNVESDGVIWPVSVNLEYNQVILALVAGYDLDIPQWGARLQPVVMIGSGPATLTGTVTLLWASATNTDTGTAGLFGFEIPLHWGTEGEDF